MYRRPAALHRAVSKPDKSVPDPKMRAWAACFYAGEHGPWVRTVAASSRSEIQRDDIGIQRHGPVTALL